MKPNPIGYNLDIARFDFEIYPEWIVKACDSIAAKPDAEHLTNTEMEGLIEYLHGGLFDEH